jgi:hypothetical protein
MEIDKEIIITIIISAEGVVKTYPKISRQYLVYPKHRRSGAKSNNITNVSYRTQISRTRPLTLGDRMNFFPLSEPKPTDNLV